MIDTLLAEIPTQDQEKHVYHDEQQDSPDFNGHKNTEQESSFIG